ncbi:MAG: ABC transporter ATP-binding protein [uncultured Paraburkholderia sp.]|nr:MAG: ABC transporter ATP-binding protein [uncultured Paraburkholderia sp.]CAH2794646.1 MAG: ABC transporter ATP-binding protein [uncultured Paraburkholderia sp.]CAH2899403.1 MAG: ABC transporter ATP-binding protein [uncultured Paraburkholderia sp.]CAH2921173.1 MAG: ABC transporter ATP-binding protein [uncultured Paraburkholderia sp.]CAH2929247.1 MAG: ABC transporter ATP-binding protein [uncultured Paraburkholderia sp.]
MALHRPAADPSRDSAQQRPHERRVPERPRRGDRQFRPALSAGDDGTLMIRPEQMRIHVQFFAQT